MLQGKPKGMSVHCARNTHFLYIQKKDLDVVTAIWNRRIENVQLNFLREIEAFRLLNNTKIKAILESFKPMHKQRGSYLFKEGDPVENVFLVRTGEFTVLKKIFIQKPPENQDTVALFRDPFFSKQKESQFFVRNISIDFEIQKLGCIQVKQFLGIEDAIFGSNFHTTSAFCE